MRICIRCEENEVDALLGYKNYTYNWRYPDIKICCDCRLAIFPEYMNPKQYDKMALAYSKKYG